VQTWSDKARRYRKHAEALRLIAAQNGASIASASMLRSAEQYENLAAVAEHVERNENRAAP